jgi:hypothetical protein
MATFTAATAATGARTARTNMFWSSVQTSRDSFNWAGADAVYRAYLRNGVRPFWTLGGTPCWATGVWLCVAPSPGIPSASYIWAFARFAQEVAKRYPLSAGIELFNEIDWINHKSLDSGKVEPERYATLVAQTYAAVRANANAGRNMPVAAGSLLFPPTNPDDPTTFLARAFASGQLAGHYDALSIHAYPTTYANGSDPTWLGQRLAGTAALMARYGDGGRRIVITESGTSINKTGASDAMTPDQRAEVTRVTWTVFNAQPQADAVWFWRATDYSDKYGFLQNDGGSWQPRRNFCTLSALVAPALPCTPVATEG